MEVPAGRERKVIIILKKIFKMSLAVILFMPGSFVLPTVLAVGVVRHFAKLTKISGTTKVDSQSTHTKKNSENGSRIVHGKIKHPARLHSGQTDKPDLVGHQI